MLFHTEVDQLVVLAAAIPILVVPKNVFYKVVHLRPILLQDSLQKLSYLVLLKLLVVILVEFNQLQVDHLSHLKGQLVGGKLKPMMLHHPRL